MSNQQATQKSIFINLPVANLEKSTAFYEAIGATKNPHFSDHTASCMVISDTIYVMLLTHDKWRQFTSKPIVDAHSQAQVLLCISEQTRQAVSDRVASATADGGTPDPIPTQDHGFMFGRSFQDPDGHIWEVMWMNPEGMA
ncbi:MAG: lactoylglutathione lyase [Armatimonadetes bacterium 55-13]|nr:lactoylglutathione lyase [Armatimonadota bacterium]OJU62078.1 MAG: lactoylglutathione lyase [Armatimonadetes bacterium 55-13]